MTRGTTGSSPGVAERAGIDALDAEIVRLLLERRDLAARLIDRRVTRGGPARDLEREQQVLGVVRARANGDPAAARHLEAVYRAVLASAPLPACRVRGEREAGRVEVGAARFGAGHFELIAGPCAVESVSQLHAAARAARAAGASVLRGGVFKPRTRPGSFQGLGLAGLPLLRRAADAFGMACVTEVIDPALVSAVAGYADALQIGARSMHSTPLLREAARSGLPVVLKRGMGATVEDLLGAVEYLRDAGAHDVIVCLRGIRTFSDASRFTLDLAAIAAVKERAALPVIVDPSHAAGRRALVEPLALAAVAAGADGLLVEVHADPAAALCDGPQALTPEDLARLMRRVSGVRGALRKG